MSKQNDTMCLTPIYLVMAAGSGTRLFPMSLPNAPKQFIKLENEYSLIQNTILRLPRSGDLVITTMEKYLDKEKLLPASAQKIQDYCQTAK